MNATKWPRMFDCQINAVLLDALGFPLRMFALCAHHSRFPAPPLEDLMIDPRNIGISGIGALTAAGDDLDQAWASFLRADVCIRPVEAWDTKGCATGYAGEIRRSNSELHAGLGVISSHRSLPMERGEILLFRAFQEALSSAGLDRERLAGKRVGIFLGSSLCGFTNLEREYPAFLRDGSAVTAAGLLAFPINLGADRLAYEYGLRGPRLSFSTACSASLHAVIWGWQYLERGWIDLAVAIGTDPLSMISLAGFSALDALAREASTPFSTRDEGLSLGEGGGVVLLERSHDVRARGASLLVSLSGFGCNSDAYHVTASDPTGRGIGNCMKSALTGIDHEGLREGLFVAAHGTGTPHNDKVETQIGRASCRERV